MRQLKKNSLKVMLDIGVFMAACFTMLDVKAQNADTLNAEVPALSTTVRKIVPTGKISAVGARLRTPAMMAQDALSMPLPVDETPPFMPTESGYWMEKAAADAESDAALKAGATKPAELGNMPILGVPIQRLSPNFKGVSFEGAAQSGGYPPDTHGAVGPSNVVEVVNFQVVAYSKTGVLQKSTPLNAFFGSTEFVFDPRVVYDQTWKRWVISAARAKDSTKTARFFLAVSKTRDPAGSYYIYDLSAFSKGDWFDYPGLGMDQDAVLITANIYTAANSYKTTTMIPFAKARLYNGLGFSVPVYSDLAPTLQPPIVYDQNNSAYFVAANNNMHLHLYQGQNLSSGFQGATFALQAYIDVPDYAVPPSAPQLGTKQKLDTLDRRFVNSSAQWGDSLWNVHTIKFGSFAAAKFYQIDTEGVGANTVKQQGFISESSASFDFNASITANASGEAFVTWTSTDVSNAVATSRHNARIRFSGRRPTDQLGIISAGFPLFTSSVALTGNPSGTAGIQRWGDYSAVSLDPKAGVTAGCGKNRHAYIINEKINTASLWGSRIGKIGFCD